MCGGKSGKRKLNSLEDRKEINTWISKEKEDKRRIEIDLTGECSKSGSPASLQQLWESDDRCLEPGLSKT